MAAEFAGWLLKLKRSMTDLRRESGIDREIAEVRRSVENAVPREVRSFNLERSVQQGVQTLKQEVAAPVVDEFTAARDSLTMDDRREVPATSQDAPAINPAATDPQVPPATTQSHP